MKIITLRIDDTVCIGNDIQVKLLTIVARSKVRLGLHAPPDVKILRSELTPNNRDANDASDQDE